jgi:hypothetical protein
VNIPGYGGAAAVTAAAAAFFPTESPEIGASIPEVPYVNTPYGAAYQGASDAELGALADAQGGAMLYRSGITGFNSATEGQFWSFDNPATTEGYADVMGMPSQVAAEGYPFIVSARLAPGGRRLLDSLQASQVAEQAVRWKSSLGMPLKHSKFSHLQSHKAGPMETVYADKLYEFLTEMAATAQSHGDEDVVRRIDKARRNYMAPLPTGKYLQLP